MSGFDFAFFFPLILCNLPSLSLVLSLIYFYEIRSIDAFLLLTGFSSYFADLSKREFYLIPFLSIYTSPLIYRFTNSKSIRQIIGNCLKSIYIYSMLLEIFIPLKESRAIQRRLRVFFS